MVLFFQSPGKVIAVDAQQPLAATDIAKLEWLFSGAEYVDALSPGDNQVYIGPRKEMLTPWSTNACEIAQNMGVQGIARIEEYWPATESSHFDPLLQQRYLGLNQNVFAIENQPQPIQHIDDIAAYNRQEALALSNDEVQYLQSLAKKLGRSLTDSEIFGFSQVNSEHCRHKIFNGVFEIDGQTMPSSLFALIKQTTQTNPNRVVSAYKDNCAFIQGPVAEQFAPQQADKPSYFGVQDAEMVISLKAETHNFPTTVEPFNGAATGTGGEIRDRIAGGKGAYPMAGTAVYMTSYPRIKGHIKQAEQHTQAREWLYQSPESILIKASNGASDFGNKFGQPLIVGSLLTFEQERNGRMYGYDKVIMQAGGVGYGKKIDSLKDNPKVGDVVVLLGGDNYRIGMGGGAVSSVATGEYANAVELNAVQRSNPEMQKRVYNAIRGLCEGAKNPVVSIHDHGAGGHLNCLSELVEQTGGEIDLSKLPIGDPTLSAKEIVGNESQERMGLLVHEEDLPLLQRIAERERAPMYVVGRTTGSHQFTFVDPRTGLKPIDLQMDDMIGNPPKTLMQDTTIPPTAPNEVAQDMPLGQAWDNLLEQVLLLEAVGCKDWLTNKVDRSVSGRIAMQQCAGEVQLPLNNLGVVAIDYQGQRGIATSIGHAPQAALISAPAGSRLAIAESLTNLVWAPLEQGLRGVSLSANWMWPCRNSGEDARLYSAVKAASDFALALGINIPTGKDSLSMTQKYPDGSKVLSPGTVIISTVGEVTDIRKVVSPVLCKTEDSSLLYIDLSGVPLSLGGSALEQVLGKPAGMCPDIANAELFGKAFAAVQELIDQGLVLAGHDVSGGGIITALLEMCFANAEGGLEIDLSAVVANPTLLFAENPALILQVHDAIKVQSLLHQQGIASHVIGVPTAKRSLRLHLHGTKHKLDIDALRDVWYTPSYLLDRKQSGEQKAKERFDNYKHQVLRYTFPATFSGTYKQYGIDPKRRKASGVRAAIIREKGVNSDREMAWALYLAGFDVKDVHMTDLIAGREDLSDVQMLVFVGGFSNSDVFGSAKGWAGAFLFNERAKQALDKFYARPDTLSLGVCNGCQLMVELGLLTPEDKEKPRMEHNDSHKFESNFISVQVPANKSVMLSALAGSTLGIWTAHGEGKFSFPKPANQYQVVLQYAYNTYPANPNGSPEGVAGICSADGRHLAMMPHLERSTYPWNWAYYPSERANDEYSPWVTAFVEARKWLQGTKK